MKNKLILSALAAIVLFLGGCNKDPQNDDNPDGPINSNEIFYVNGERFVVLEQNFGQRWFFQLLPSNEAVLPPYYSPGYPYAKFGAQFYYQEEYKGDIEVPESFTLDGITYTITQIDRCAFEECKELNSIIIPNTVKSIGDMAFCHCNSLSHVQLPISLDSIHERTFYYCENLRSIQFPESLKYIGFQAFIMSGIEELNFTSFVKLDQGAFTLCHHLKTVTFSDGTDTISRDVFSGCEELSSVFIPQSVTVIDDYAFSNTKLSSVDLPESLMRLGSWAFGGCSSLKTISCLAPNPPYASEVFIETELNVIYVPNESLQKYLLADGWCDYADIIQPIQ